MFCAEFVALLNVATSTYLLLLVISNMG